MSAVPDSDLGMLGVRGRQKLVYQWKPEGAADEAYLEESFDFFGAPFTGTDGGVVRVMESMFSQRAGELISEFISNECDYRIWEERYKGTENPPAFENSRACPYDTNGACAEAVCELEQANCSANLLLELATATKPMVLHGQKSLESGAPPVSVELRIPLQDAETRVAFREAASIVAVGGVVQGVAELRRTGDWDSADAYADLYSDAQGCSAPYDPKNPAISTAETWMSLVEELNQLIVETSDAAVEGYVALADAELGRHVDLKKSAESAFNIRAHAANILTGNPELLPRQGARPLCSRPSLSAMGRMALELFREAALHPAEIAAVPGTNSESPVPLDDILLDLENRLSKLRGEAWTVAIAEAKLGISRDDFAEARLALAEEIAIFGRSSTIKMSSRPNLLTSDDPNDKVDDLYASTGTRPSSLPPAYYHGQDLIGANSSIFFYDIQDENTWFDAPFYGTSLLIPRSISASNAPLLIDFVLSELLADAQAQPGGLVEHLKPIVPRMQRLSSEALRRTPGYAQVWTDLETDVGYMFAYLPDDGRELLLVSDTDSLSCLDTGVIEGQPCTWGTDSSTEDDVTVFRDVLNGSLPTSTLFDFFKQETTIASDLGIPDLGIIQGRLERAEQIGSSGRAPHAFIGLTTGKTYYLMRLRKGAQPGHPGSYETLAPLLVESSAEVAILLTDPMSNSAGNSWGDWENIAFGSMAKPGVLWTADAFIAPELERRAGEIMTPSRDWCARPAVSCSGISYDARIPLETDFTSDQYEFESSWRSYLDAAEAAAIEADRLGEETISLGLDIDIQAEGALQELEAECGLNISLDPLRQHLENTPATIDVIGLIESGEIAEVIPEATSTDLARLKTCIGASSIRDFVSLGATPLCVWTIDGDPRQLCALVDGDSTELECPREVLPGTPCELPVSGSNRYVAHALTKEGGDLLGYFDPPEESETLPVVETPSCNALRRLRVESNTGLQKAWWYLAFGGKYRNYWSAENLQKIGLDINWEAALGSHSKLIINRDVVVDTGGLNRAPSHAGLCGGIILPEGMEPEGQAALDEAYECDGLDGGLSLLCNPVDCSDPEARAQLNYRLATAAMAARWLSLNSFDGFKVPGRRNFPEEFQRTNEFPAIPFERSDLVARTFDHQEDPNYTGGCFEQTASSDDTLWFFRKRAVDVFDPQFSGSAQLGATECGDASDGGRALWIRELHDDGTKPNFGVPIDENKWVRRQHVPLRIMRKITADDWGAGYQEAFSGSEDASLSISCAGGCDLADAPWRHEDSWLHQFSSSDSDVRKGMLLDGLELLCEAGRSDDDAFPCGQEPDVTISSRRQVKWAARQIECFGVEIAEQANRSVFVGVPQAAVDALSDQAAVGIVGEAGGNQGALISQLRSTMIELSEVPFQIAAEVQGSARDIRGTLTALDNIDLAIENLEVERQLAIRNATDACASASLDVVTNPSEWITGGAGAIAGCAKAMTNMAAQMRQIKNETKQNGNTETAALDELEESMSNRAVSLNHLMTRFSVAREQMQSTLRDIERSRSTAERLFSRALFLGSDGAGRVFQSATVARRRMNTTVERYARAKDNAIRLSFLARRGIEQRFGVNLSSMVDDMSQVDAPATWADSLCTMSGINYDKVRDESVAMDHYADEFVGDYVRKLRQFVDSYAHDYPSAAGKSRIVVSLRDDVQGIRDTCLRTSPNMLAYSNKLDRLSSADEPGWDVVGVATDPATGMNLPGAIRVEAIGGGDGGPVVASGPFGTPKPYRVTFGSPGCVPGPCGYKPETVLGQLVDTAGGRYRLSWYGRPGVVDRYGASPIARDASEPERAVFARGADTLQVLPIFASSSVPTSAGWRRYTTYFYHPGGEAIEITIGNPSTSVEAGAEVDIAGLMLETVGESGGAVGDFIATDGAGRYPQQVCEDTDGDQFRSRAWRRNCMALCESGFGAGCARSDSLNYCYWETDFHVTQEAIDRGLILRNAGFARGNFNYRMDSVAVNFVGSAARTCENELLPSTCYSAGFIPYSLEHVGPFEVRNYMGETVKTHLFPGVIESANGLAAERYITNPISSADEALISQYQRFEFQGRPLTGSYVLRVWDGPGVNFAGIEDVQLVIDYRYWTRQR